MSKQLRCAVYTRKSSEEGLDQDFNSLDAQREACEAFILSQTGEGWKLVTERYDDGGISGGTMDRPGLRRLLEDIRKNRIDIVVVYKIDRLTRSLMDFAKMVDIFDGNDVSFVSVTQAFNTTTSMGRLTLNVLLSFAQFEREVTAERIRDKIAASKKKGMWMGGNVPLGYEANNRKLIVNQAEAATVRFLFDRYLELGSVRKLSEDARDADLSVRRTRRKDGSEYVTRPFGRGNLYHLLSNPVYVGKVRHGKQVYDGEHEAIISGEQFEKAQQLLATKAPKRSHTTNNPDTHLLTGLVFDETGDRLSPTHANKKGVRYRYYVSQRLIQKRKQKVGKSEDINPANAPSPSTDLNHQMQSGWRIPAKQLEPIIEREVTDLLTSHNRLIEAVQPCLNDEALPAILSQTHRALHRWKAQTQSQRKSMLQHLFRAITLKPGWIRLELDRRNLIDWLMEDGAQNQSGLHLQHQKSSEDEDDTILIIERPLTMKRRGVETRLVLNDQSARDPSPDAALIDLVTKAHRYLGSLTDGSSRSLTDIADVHQTDLSEVSRLLPLAFLSPKITQAILTGTQPVDLTAQRLSRITDMPTVWHKQTELLGF